MVNFVAALSFLNKTRTAKADINRSWLTASKFWALFFGLLSLLFVISTQISIHFSNALTLSLSSVIVYLNLCGAFFVLHIPYVASQ